LLQEAVQLFDLDLPIAIQLAQLFYLALRSIRLAFGATARQLLTRALDLNAHLPHFTHQIAAHLVHVGGVLVAAAKRSSKEANDERLHRARGAPV